MGNANNKMSRSCVPGANNKAQTGTMDERIDALVLRLHEVLSFPFFLSLLNNAFFERAVALLLFFPGEREFEKM
jgi:hypothetical protein